MVILVDYIIGLVIIEVLQCILSSLDRAPSYLQVACSWPWMMAVPSQFHILIAILRANQRKAGGRILSAVEKVRCVRNGGLLYRYDHNNSCTSVWYFWVVQIASSLAIYSMNFICSECYRQTSGCCCLGLSCEVFPLVCLHYMQWEYTLYTKGVSSFHSSELWSISGQVKKLFVIGPENSPTSLRRH